MTATFYVGDAVTVMNTLPEKSVDLILTSPPFLALRSYLPQDHPDKALEGGSQATPGAYIDWLLDVVEACARVLARHGSLCFELGDTYSGSGGGGGDYLEGGWREGQQQFAGSAASMKESNAAHWRQKNAFKDAWPLAKSLSLIPETFRWAMVYGINPHTGRKTEPWRLRNVIRWVRPNPPVGALGDKFRPATSELMVFCKAKDRFFDLDAVREPADPANKRPSLLKRESIPGRTDQVMNPLGPDGQRIISNPAGAPPLDWWNIPPGGYPGAHYAVWPPELLVKPIKAMCPEKVCNSCNRPSRVILEHLGRERFRQAPTPDEFAVFMQDAMAGTGISVFELAERIGVTPWMIRHYRGETPTPLLPSLARWQQLIEILPFPRHLVEAMEIVDREYETPDYGLRDIPERLGAKIPKGSLPKVVVTGWSDCGHDDYRPGLVLDPFAGSGTTLSVATGHGRDAIGIDLDERNYALALDRVGPLVLSRAA